MNKKILIYGASGHGKVASDIAELNGYEDILFYDDDLNKNEIDNYKVIHDLSKLDGYDYFVSIGNNEIREKISKKLGNNIVSLIHPSSVIAKDVKIGKGVLVAANAVINPGTTIEDGVIINTSSSIDHDNYIGEYCHISVNAHTAGSVKIGKKCFLGISSTVINNIKITDEVTIGAGGVVIKDINEKGIYVGVPVRRIK